MNRFAFIILLIILISGQCAYSDSLAMHLYISDLQDSRAPIYYMASDSIIFTYKNELPRFQPRQVGVAFEHEQFSIVHQMQYYDTKNENKQLLRRIYFLFLPVDSQLLLMHEISYRYIVDGIWIEDPRNPEYKTKINGARLSVAHVPEERKKQPVSPKIVDTSTNRSKVVKFLYLAEPSLEVFLAGSFNNWDPFMYRLEENPINPGEYSIEIRLLPGNYHYNYYYRGRKIKDPLNKQSSYDIEGYEYSVFAVDS